MTTTSRTAALLPRRHRGSPRTPCALAAVGAVAFLSFFAVRAAHAAEGPSAGVTAKPSPGKARVAEAEIGAMSGGAKVHEYTLTNASGMEVKVMTLGATLTSVKVPDRSGALANVTLCLDRLEDYVRGHPLFGSVVGRYANRIAGARFTLDGKEYLLTPNAGRHHIHGGNRGFQSLVWSARTIDDGKDAAVVFSHVSPDGHEGYPGTLSVSVKYSLTGGGSLVLEYEASTDKPTHVNLTNHAYWNLAGAGSGDVLGHELMLSADRYLPADALKIPLGEQRSVDGTPMDFRTPKPVGRDISRVEDSNYDHCYVVRKKPGEDLSFFARLADPKSGRVMEVWTTEPGVQLYTAKGLGGRWKVGGIPYGPYHGLCLETQHFPDSPNRPAFPSTVLRPGEKYRQVTEYRFSVRKDR